MRLSLAVIFTALLTVGCSAIQGERFWWDDEEQAKLENDYLLPNWPAETPLAPGEKLFVDKKLPPDEPERAKREEARQFNTGIPRAGVPDPYANPVHIPMDTSGGFSAQTADTAEENTAK